MSDVINATSSSMSDVVSEQHHQYNDRMKDELATRLAELPSVV
jgi:hypothetical protein